MSLGQCPSSRRRWPTQDAAEHSKLYLGGGQVVVSCVYGCGGFHLEAEKNAPRAKSQPQHRAKGIPRVSKKRAAQIRERRVMLQAKYPDATFCEVPWCNQVADDAHESLTRARGGSITDLENIKAVCRPHHNEITFEEPDWAYRLGFLIHSWEAA